LTPFALAKHHKLEKAVLNSSDKVIVVSPTMKTEFTEMTDTPISMIPNGYDSEDFEGVNYTPNSKFTLSHIGMMASSRNPKILWEALSELSQEHPDFSDQFTLRLIGKVDSTVQADIQTYGLNHLVEIINYVPHDEVVKLQQQSESLLLVINNTPNAAMILTGKLFEYIAANRPIICISPVVGDVKSVLEETKSGTFILNSEKEKLKIHLLEQLKNWKEGNSTYQGVDTEKYSRKFLTKQICSQLNKIIS
jgi:glycosyltransferase involved in cell wall biosynthesis